MSAHPRRLWSLLMLGLTGLPAAGQVPSEKARHDALGDPLPLGAVQRLGTVRLRHGGAVPCAAFLPDGKTLVSRGGDAVLRFWDPATGKETRHLDDFGHATGGRFALSADGRLFFAHGPGPRVRLWDLKAG